MYRTFKIALATALLVTTTLSAEAGRLPGPSTSPAGGIDAITTSSSGEIDSPGDAFVPWERGEEPKRAGTGPQIKPYVASGPMLKPDLTMHCSTSGLPDSVTIHNKGNTKILKGTKLLLVLPNGEEIIVTVPYDLGPDWGFHAGPFPGLELTPCAAEVIEVVAK